MEIKIYVANLGKYTEGELVGEWFTLPCDLKDIRVAIGVAHINEADHFIPYVEEDDRMYEEWAIHDYEAPFKIEEYDSIDKLNEIAEAMEDMDEQDIEAVFALVNDGIATDFDDGVEKLQDVLFYHECNDMSDVAYQSHEETGTDMDAPLMGYVDWERVGRDMEIEGTFIELENRVWMQYIG